MRGFNKAIRQRAIFLCLVATVSGATHLAYHWIKPQWVLYRKAEQLSAKQQWMPAIALYQESLDMGMPPAKVQLKIAQAYVENKDFAKAIEWYRRYLILYPRDLWAHRSLAGAYMGNQQFDEAAKEYEFLLQSGELNKHE